MFIYKITNKINGKCYIGQTTGSCKRRFGVHKALAKKGQVKPLYAAIRKYGEDNFSFEVILEYSNLEQLNTAEEFYIEHFCSLYPDGYNLLPGGDNRRHNITTKQKMSNSHRGKTLSDKHKKLLSEAAKTRVRPKNIGEKISQAKRGKKIRPHTKEHADKIASARKGVPRSEQTKRKISESHKNRFKKILP